MTASGTVPPKRLYKEADVALVEGGYTIHLDARAVRTPMGNALILPGLPLAEAIAAEWRAQGDSIEPKSMPHCGYANTAIDRIGADRQAILANVLNFAETDLLCYRAEQPGDLADRQLENWQPLLDWAAEALGAHLRVTSGVSPIKQPTEAMEALKGKLLELDDMKLAAVASLAAACGSLVLALALAENHINPEQVFLLSLLDELFQNERWGQDAEAEDRQRRLKEDLASAASFLSLLDQTALK